MAAVPFERIDAGAPKTARSDPILVVDDIVKRFETPDGVLTAVDHVSLSVAPGEFVGVIGPSGCGKSTLFNVIGGLLDGYEGTVKVAGERVRGPHPAVGMIFQEESTFPWRNVIDNVAFPLEIAGLPKAERYERAVVVAETMLMLAPDLADLWREAGLLHARLGNMRSAAAALEQVVLRTPDGTARHQAAALLQQLRSKLN